MADGCTAEQADRVSERASVAGRKASPTGTKRVAASASARTDPPKEGPAAAREVAIALDAGVFLRAALGCIVVLAFIGVLVVILDHLREEGVPRLILRGFLLDAEANVPTLFAFSLLLFAAALLAAIGAGAFLARERYRFHWALLAALFFLVGYDEAARMHEKLNDPVGAALGGSSGMAHFPWVIPAGGLVAALTLIYLPFVRDLPAPIGRLFVLSAALYVGGALGVEMLGAAHAETHGVYELTYYLITTVEETLEMLGVAVFAYALVRFLGLQQRKVRLSFR